MGTGLRTGTARQIQAVLEGRPDSATWGAPQDVTIQRGPSGTLGIKVETFQGLKETYTVITKVKEECTSLQGSLTVFDRILLINGSSVRHLSKDKVKTVLSASSGPFVKLSVCHLQTFKVLPVRDRGIQQQQLSPTSQCHGFRSLNIPLGSDDSSLQCLTPPTESSYSSLPMISSQKDTKTLNHHCLNTVVPKDKVHAHKNGSLPPVEIELQERSSSPRILSSSPQVLSSSPRLFSSSPRISARSEKHLTNSHKPEFSAVITSQSSDSSYEQENAQTDSVLKVKRGFSQVSGTSSNQSVPETGSSAVGVMGKSKGDNSKPHKRFYVPNTPEADREVDELTPLKSLEAPDHSRMFSVLQDPAVSVQDIVFDEDLPQLNAGVLVSGTSSVGSQCSCASCSGPAGRCKGCGIKNSANLKKKSGSRSGAISVPVMAPEGHEDQDTGSFYVKNPHLAKWDQTKVVTIEKCSSSSKFGFNYKVKIGKNADGSVEIYTLVDSVVSGGPAEHNLHVGDWIRSVNGTPVQVPMNAFSLLSNTSEESSIRLVIQRPVGLSQQPVGESVSVSPPDLDKKEKTPTETSNNISASSPVPGNVDVVPFDTTLLPWVVTENSTQKGRLASAQEMTWPKCGNSGQLLSGPGSDQGEGLVSRGHMNDMGAVRQGIGKYTSCPVTPNRCDNLNIVPGSRVESLKEYQDMSNANETGFPRAVRLPKVRMFVCGSEAVNCARLILRDFDIDSDPQTVQKTGYSYVGCSMVTNNAGSLVVSQSCSNLYSQSVDQSNSLLSAMSQSESRSDDGRCKSCGCDIQSVGSQNVPGTVINVELFVVTDDRFFHNCCNYLFTKSSIFILTFDGAKMLRSAASEITRLQSLTHTIRSFVGYDCSILSCGLLEGDVVDRSMADEVNTLFYTHYGHQLRKYCVSGPELIHFEPSQNLEGCQHLQTIVWKVAMETVQRQRVLKPSLLVLDHLHALRSRELFLTETQLMDVIRQKLPSYQQDVHQMVLTELITCGEIISGKAAPISPSHLQRIESLVMIDPRVLLDRLFALITMPPRSLQATEDKQKWIKAYSSGTISIPDFLTMCVGQDSMGQFVADFMECYGLVFRRVSSQSSHMEYFIPYFALEPSSMETPHEDKKDTVLYVQFKQHASSQLYFSLLFNIAAHTDCPKNLAIQATNCAEFTHHGVTCTAFHQKLDDRIKFLFKREDKSSALSLPELYKWLYAICQMTLAADDPFLMGPPCPLGEKCQTSSPPQVHLIELKDCKTEMCGMVRIATHKLIKRWLSTEDKDKMEPVRVTDLPWSVFRNICNELRPLSEMGRDWRGLAGLMGYTVKNIKLYEVTDNPPEALLLDWGRSQNGTVEDLIKLLMDEEMERNDIVMEIRKALAQM